MQISRGFWKFLLLLLLSLLLTGFARSFILRQKNSESSDSETFEPSEHRFNSKDIEFRVELKDVNISYFYYGFGEHSCNNESNILMSTLSRPNAFDLRKGVRESWKKDIPSSFTHKFFIGSTHNETLHNLLREESLRFGDIIFTDLIDSYLNLTLKMNAVYQWQQYFCPNVDYLFRADEDTVLDVARFQYWFSKDFNVTANNLDNIAIFGHVAKNGIVERNIKEKWHIPFEAYDKLTYPDYVGGSTYFLTTKSVKMILNEAKNHKFVTVDDAFYTGIVADAIGITRIDLKKHFVKGNPVNRWDHECDENSKPYMLSVFDEAGEIEKELGGYDKTLKKLKGLNCSE